MRLLTGWPAYRCLGRDRPRPGFGSSAHGRRRTGQEPGGVLAATCISTLVVNANTSAVSILLPAISEDTGTSVETLQWAVTGYSLVGAAVIVTSGSLGDVFGRSWWARPSRF
ncbi:MFS transporter [Kribbella sp. NPDC049584]|uniref:MFS transporter n=1 Tax=Kribbella sp. NPDC049584 TaxID=3154833 RepID=UPI00341D0524